MIGSHLDTQPAGGKFDGILGVLAGLEVVHVLNDHHIETEHPIEIVSFTNEEGARFQPPMLGSGGIAGVFEKDFILGRKDKEGRRFDEELKRVGYFGSAEDRPKDIHRYLELHIEQGPVLEKENFPVAAVEGISGMTWIEVTVTGESNHAGPTPMVMRRDALVVTAKMISVINQLVRVLDEDLTATTGQIKISPTLLTVFPAQRFFQWMFGIPKTVLGERRLA